MEVKVDKEAKNRLVQERMPDAPYLFADLKSYIGLLRDENLQQQNDRKGITIFKSDEITVVLSVFLSGAIMDNVNVNGYMTLQVIDGNARIITAEGDRELGANEMVIFHPGVEHSIQGIDDSVIMLTHYNSAKASGKVF